MAKKKKLFLIIGAAIVFAVFIVLAIVKNQEKLIPVTVETVEKGKIISIVTASGKVEAKTKVNISADVMGKIIKLPVVEGQNVEKSQLLVEIDKTQNLTDVAQMRAALAQAKVGEEEAQINYSRQNELFNRKLISQAEYDIARINLDRAKAYVNQSQASLDRAFDYLDKCTIKAPMAGTITTLNSEEGENVIIGTMNNIGTVIMVISDLSEIEVKADVDETDIARLELGQEVEILLDAFPDTTFNGKVTEIGNAAKITGGYTEQVTNFEVTVLITDTVPGIKPGMNATVDITTNIRDDVIKIPIQSVVMRKPPKKEQNNLDSNSGAVASTNESDSSAVSDTGKDKEKEIDGVFIVEDKTVKFVPVVAGISDQQHIEIISGIEPDQKIVTGTYKTLRTLKDGDKVKPDEKKFDESSS
ncbi:MAG: efflux RND transporter periplasmic adaptor subunit [candidate division Zixibacteria bacterium]|nr:efflux RND transporter periplasmic adaptor subunit [candidate division Zixibacteria bacterium]